jgi:putative flavoprotein involved in K+ transport
MPTIDTLIIGAGQAGLAMSRCLTDAGVEHVLLERGRVAERWRSERWDSLRLLTPRWLSSLPGSSFDGPDAHGFMHRDEVVDYIEGYGRSFLAPVLTGVTVKSVSPRPMGFRVATDVAGDWLARDVIIATGECDQPIIPAMASRLVPDVEQVVPTRYRNPGQLRDGGVLVVGASSTGIQLAAEIQASGRPVTVAVGQHTRLPRSYRGHDILWWLDTMGLFDQRPSDVGDLDVSRGQPSLQLVGSDDHHTLDLNALRDRGVRTVGRLADIDGGRMVFDDDLLENTAAADVKLARLRLRIDAHIDAAGLGAQVGPEEPFEPVRLPDPPERLDLRDEGIRTVVWATGFRRSYPWLKVPVLDGHGEIRHTGGVTPWPGLYALGFNFLRRRSSTFIRGAGRDAVELAEVILTHRRGLRRGVA